MGGSKARSWTLGTAVLALLILVGVWFLVVSPQLASAAETNQATEDELARGDILRARLATLQAQFEDLDEYKAELEELEDQIPTTAELAEYVREAQTVAAESGITIVGMTPGVPMAVQPPVVVQPEPAGDVTDDPEADEADGEANDEADDEDAPAQAAPPASPLVAVPVSFTVVGTYAGATAFMDALQTAVPRLLLVTSMTAVSQSVSEGTGGRPATAAGDLELTIDGMIYVLPPKDATPGADPDDPADDQAVNEAGDEQGTLAPLPSTERNPFAPVAGS